MATARATRIDENQHESRLLQGKQLVAPAPPQRRAALGELGNRAQSRVIDTKNVKPKVDTRWVSAKVADVKTSKATALRLGMQKKENAVVENAGVYVRSVRASKEVTVATTKLTHTAKPMAVEKIMIGGVKNFEDDVKRNKELHRFGASKLKREDSKLTTQTLHTLRQTLNKNIKITGVKSAKVSNSSSATQSTTSSRSVSPDDVTSKIQDIDANDKLNPILMSEYVQDIYKYLNHLEITNALRDNFLDTQNEVTSKMRTILIDWIIEVHDQFKCAIDTYFLAVAIIDRYLQAVQTTTRNELQLVGVTALFIASKYEDMFPNELSEYVHITDETYTKGQILEMEKQILKALDFTLGLPLAIQFLRRFARAANLGADNIYSISKYLLQLVTTDYTLAQCPSSKLAAACLFVSLKVNAKNHNKNNSLIWTKTLEHYSQYKLQQLKPVAQQVIKILKNAPNAKVRAAYVAYGHSKHMRISHSAEINSSSILDNAYTSLEK